jgi:hypothetical protein
MYSLFVVTGVIFGIGISFLLLAGMTFRIRAMLNKPAWNGKTLPFLFIGLAAFAVGIVMFYFAYRTM